MNRNAVIALAACAAFTYALASPMLAHRSAAQNQKNVVAASVAEAQGQAKRTRAAIASGRFKEREQVALAAVPTEVGFDRFIEQVGQIANQTGVTWSGGRPSEAQADQTGGRIGNAKTKAGSTPDAAASGVISRKVALSVAAPNLAALSAFLDQLETGSRLVSISGVDLTVGKQANGGVTALIDAEVFSLAGAADKQTQTSGFGTL